MLQRSVRFGGEDGRGGFEARSHRGGVDVWLGEAPYISMGIISDELARLGTFSY